MAFVKTDAQHYSDIGAAIREKNGLATRYKPSQMAAAIREIAGFDNTVKSYEQRNNAVASYLNNTDYTNAADSVTEIDNYTQGVGRDSGLDDSLPYSLPISASGSLFVVDESTGEAWKESASSPAHALYNLVPTHTHTAVLKLANGATVSQTRLLPTGAMRMIHLFGRNHNFRDLGGWVCDGGAVRYGLLYRGAELSGKYTTATAGDLSMVRDRLFVRNEVDLRSDSDTDGGTPSDPSDDIVSSVLGDDVYYQRYAMAEYAEGINLSGTRYPVVANVLKNIMAAVVHGTVTYFHCIYGADRTGTIAFLLEAMLGMSQSDIDKDYELSSFSFLYTGAQINRAATRYRGLCDYIGTMGKSNLRDNVIQWAVRAGITVAEINAFRKAIINGNPATIQESDFVTYYTVSQNLTHCTSNHSGSVRENNALTVKLTASEGYTMTGATVTVTMGGSNITSSAYDGAGNISIPSVTGNVVITASAAEIIDVNYVTMVDGVKLDKSTGAAGSASNYAANDFFEVKSGATYKITSDSTGLTSCGICYYKSDKSIASFASLWDTGAVSTEKTFSVPSNAAYFRLRLYYQGQTNLQTVTASMSMTETVSGDTTDYLFNHT